MFPVPDSYGDRCDWYDRGDYSGKLSEADVQIRGAWTGAIGLVSVGRRRRTVAVVVTILTSGTDHSERLDDPVVLGHIPAIGTFATCTGRRLECSPP